MFILMIIIFAVLPLIQFKGWYKWWRDNDPENKYNCFSLTDIAYFQNNILFYKIKTLFESGTSNFKYNWWFYFITAFMFGGAIDLTDEGYVTPRSLCHSIVPEKYPNNLPLGFGNMWPTTPSDWKKLFKEWGKINIDENRQTYEADDNAWINAPNNFLNKWGIMPKSPLVIGFMTGWSSYNGGDLWQDAMLPLLGFKSGISYGGWFGFLQIGDDFAGRGLLEANRIVWSQDIPSNIANAQEKSKKCNAYSIANGAIGLGMGGAFAGNSLPVPPPSGAIIGGVIGLIVGGFLSAGAQPNCL